MEQLESYFQKQFIEEKFGITHVKGLIGNSMGGFEVLTWGCVYPDSVDFIISLVSSFKVGGHNYALSKIMNNILESIKDVKIIPNNYIKFYLLIGYPQWLSGRKFT